MKGIEGETIMLQAFPEFDASLVDEQALNDLEWIKEVIVAVRNIRAEMNIAPGKPLDVILRGADETASNCRVSDNIGFLKQWVA